MSICLSRTLAAPLFLCDFTSFFLGVLMCLSVVVASAEHQDVPPLPPSLTLNKLISALCHVSGCNICVVAPGPCMCTCARCGCLCIFCMHLFIRVSCTHRCLYLMPCVFLRESVTMCASVGGLALAVTRLVPCALSLSLSLSLPSLCHLLVCGKPP